ncbi:uncharacterized protein LAESUDRAFT_164197 [Laetiporus sulphureus 93-53]|uniref:Uncharacterized protein n=1 Tax=Laetiporus sulphureus 93-53 TaxID=1314785 RepID=A0A165HQ83_9APHY|nr:uncharacterized protein LAESUDRAFT_164197 [Laetiporus sulphureus 93-53]KZT12040.1 hypothetical protein LAESUDRAFT_164197 [Laetiporus sulphureus 93-53]
MNDEVGSYLSSNDSKHRFLAGASDKMWQRVEQLESAERSKSFDDECEKISVKQLSLKSPESKVLQCKPFTRFLVEVSKYDEYYRGNQSIMNASSLSKMLGTHGALLATTMLELLDRMNKIVARMPPKRKLPPADKVEAILEEEEDLEMDIDNELKDEKLREELVREYMQDPRRVAAKKVHVTFDALSATRDESRRFWRPELLQRIDDIFNRHFKSQGFYIGTHEKKYIASLRNYHADVEKAIDQSWSNDLGMDVEEVKSRLAYLFHTRHGSKWRPYPLPTLSVFRALHNSLNRFPVVVKAIATWIEPMAQMLSVGYQKGAKYLDQSDSMLAVVEKACLKPQAAFEISRAMRNAREVLLPNLQMRLVDINTEWPDKRGLIALETYAWDAIKRRSKVAGEKGEYAAPEHDKVVKEKSSSKQKYGLIEKARTILHQLELRDKQPEDELMAVFKILHRVELKQKADLPCNHPALVALYASMIDPFKTD